MIQGLKVTVPGAEVQRLLRERAAYHRTRKSEYQGTYDSLVKALGPLTDEAAPKMSSMRDPRQEAENGIERHDAKAKENDFLAQFVDTTEQFLLATDDLHKLGVIESRY